jgi:transposase-like protein
MKTIDNNDEQEDLTLISLAQEYADEDKARELLERLRWPNGPVCPHCKNTGTAAKGVVALTPKATSKSPGRKGLYFCGSCRKQFSVTVKTVFEGSHIPISKWLMAMFIICSSKKSISANQLHRMLKLTYKTAWFMAHRIRFAMADDNKPLSGTVEVDETYIGGKGDMKLKPAQKIPVVALIERDGTMKTRVVETVTQKNLGRILHECVSKEATVNTDKHVVYKTELKPWKRHDVVNHSKLEYSRNNADGTTSGVNHCESYFSLLKRGIIGSWHHVSREHLPKYADEFSFRRNTNKCTDGERMEILVPMIEGRRLMYRKPAN